MFEIRVWESEGEWAADVPTAPEGGLRCYAPTVEDVLAELGIQIQLASDSGMELATEAA